MDIKDYRNAIDGLDQEIAQKLVARYHLCSAIGQEKRLKACPVENLKREQEILESMPGSGEFLWALQKTYRYIFQVSKSLQKKRRYRIYLTGMPGAGKTTVGRALAQAMGEKFYDLDEEIEKQYGPILQIFGHEGEEGFRKKEEKVLRSMALKKGIFALGGGTILRKECREILDNFWILYLYRPIEEIIKNMDYQARPLLEGQEEAVHKLWRDREFIYENYYDFRVDNISSLENVIQEIEEKIYFFF